MTAGKRSPIDALPSPSAVAPIFLRTPIANDIGKNALDFGDIDQAISRLRGDVRGHVATLMVEVRLTRRRAPNAPTHKELVYRVAEVIQDFAPNAIVNIIAADRILVTLPTFSAPRNLRTAAENLLGNVQLNLAEQRLFPQLRIGASSTATSGLCSDTLLKQTVQAAKSAAQDSTHISVFEEEAIPNNPRTEAPWSRPKTPYLRLVR